MNPPCSPSRFRPRGLLGDDRGVGLVEVLVAILVAVAGILAVVAVFDTSRRSTFRAEQSQVVNDIAQREMEAIRDKPYDELALISAPPTSSDPSHPNHRVVGGEFALNEDGTNLADLVVQGTTDAPTGTIRTTDAFSNGDVSGRIYRYVVWRNDLSCSSTVCPGPHDYRRVIVIVTLDDVAISSGRAYTEVQSDFIDPNATTNSSNDPSTPGATPRTGQQLFLSDTTCNYAVRQPITGSHLQHQTWGTCDQNNPKRPDTLFPSAPPDPDPDDPTNPPEYDYADDIEPQPGNVDKGLQLLRQDGAGCDYTGGPDPGYKIHRWVTEPFSQDFAMSGQATLWLFTRTIDSISGPGSLCLFLFKRHETVVGGNTVATDTLLIDQNNPPNPFFVYSLPLWPMGSWGPPQQMVMKFNSTSVQAGDRLGLEIAVRRTGTSGDYLEFMYDHPEFKSRLEVETTTPL